MTHQEKDGSGSNPSRWQETDPAEKANRRMSSRYTFQQPDSAQMFLPPLTVLPAVQGAVLRHGETDGQVSELRPAWYTMMRPTQQGRLPRQPGRDHDNMTDNH